MPLFYFVLKAGGDSFPDTEGVELPDVNAARAHAVSVARELMRNRECPTGSWRLEACDDYLIPQFEILFAEANDKIDHLLPQYRETFERVSRSTAELHDALVSVQEALGQVRDTFARIDALVAYISTTGQQPHRQLE